MIMIYIHLMPPTHPPWSSQIPTHIRSEALAEAAWLIRTRGYLGFDLEDLAITLSIGEAGAVRAFSSKEELCLELVRQHIERVKAELREIDLVFDDAESCLIAFAAFFYEEFESEVPSLSCALSAARSGIPTSVRRQVTRLFRLQVTWIRSVLRKHWAHRAQQSRLSPERAAHLLLAALEGEALVECAMGTREPSASNFTQLLVVLGIDRMQ